MSGDQEPVRSAAGDRPTVEPRALVIRGMSADTPQTEGMHRQVAIDKAKVPTERLWFGRVTCPPETTSAAHHHGPAETGGYMLSGERIRVLFGEGFKEYIEVTPGDFLFVPAYLPHIEVNPTTVEAEFITVRSPDNIYIVVNLDEDGAPTDDSAGPA